MHSWESPFLLPTVQSQTQAIFPMYVSHSDWAQESQGHGLKDPHLQTGGDERTHWKGLSWGFNNIIHVKYIVQD